MITIGSLVAIDINPGIAFDWVLVLALLVTHTDGNGMTIGTIKRWISTLTSNAIVSCLSWKISLSVESWKLWFILNEIILTILKNGGLVIEAS